jgi:hypothetical protein
LTIIQDVVWWPVFLATDLEVPGSILGVTTVSEKQWICNRVHPLGVVRITEELLE